MRHQRIAIPVVALVLSIACASVPRTSADEMIAGARALDAAFVDAWNRGDAEAMSRLNWDSPDAVLFPAGALEARGTAAIRQTNAQTLAALRGSSIELIESHQMPAGDVVIGWGKWRVTVPGPNGTKTEILGRHTDVKAIRDGRWVYLIDHASVPLPPAN